MTVEIKEKCCCGSEFYVKDTVVFGNTAAERYKQFLNAHLVCRDAEAYKKEKEALIN